MSLSKSALFPVFFLLFGGPAFGGVAHMNSEDLLAQADLVAAVETISVDQGIDTTRTQLRLVQVFKGSEAPGSLVTVESGGGKVFIDEDEPSFTTMRANLVFLQKNGVQYSCVNKADGQKPILADSVYPYHDNIGYGVPLKDYMKALETAVKTGSPEKPKS